MNKEKAKEVLEKIVKSRVWEFIFLIIYPILILFLTESISGIYMFDKYYKISSIINFGATVFIMKLLIPYIFIILISVFLRLISKNSFISNLILTIVCLLITIISYYKIQILEVPLFVTDVFLLKNILQIAGYGNLFFEPTIIVIIILLAELLFIQYIILKKQDKRKITVKEIVVRIILAIIVFVVIASACVTNKEGNLFYISNKQFEFMVNYSSYGATFMFFKSIENLFPEKAEGYSENTIKEMKDEIQNEPITDNKSEEKIKPNVIAVMAESLFDITKVDKLEFSEDPLKNIREISNEYYSGNIVSPSYAGGTSVVEFEFLTGFTSNFYGTNIYPYSQYVNAEVNSMVRTYDSNNYQCIAMHPNKGSFYNREVAYDFLGFEEKIFLEDMDIKEENKTYVGGHKTDVELAREIIKTYENASKDENKFIFAITMQNHSPHIYDNYTKYDISMECKDNSISEKDKGTVLAYAQGVYNTDKAFKELVDYFENIEEPTIIVLFGDHLPGITAIQNLYYGSNNLKKHQTPYCVYANYDIEEIKFEENISAANLGLKVMEMANIDVPWYYEYLENIYEQYPVITNQFIFNKNNEICTNTEIEEIKNYHILQYDLLHKRKYIPIS